MGTVPNYPVSIHAFRIVIEDTVDAFVSIHAPRFYLTA
jgi:hypothetical protein